MTLDLPLRERLARFRAWPRFTGRVERIEVAVCTYAQWLADQSARPEVVEVLKAIPVAPPGYEEIPWSDSPSGQVLAFASLGLLSLEQFDAVVDDHPLLSEGFPAESARHLDHEDSPALSAAVVMACWLRRWREGEQSFGDALRDSHGVLVASVGCDAYGCHQPD